MIFLLPKYNVLLKLVNAESHDRMMGMFSSFTWILDIGVTNNVTSNVVLLRDLCDVFSPLGLLDGKQVMVTKRGCLHLDDLIIMTMSILCLTYVAIKFQFLN